LDDKLDGISNLMEYFGNTVSLEEQFDLLIEKIPVIVKALIHQPNPEFKDAYFQIGNFICSMLFATKFKIDAYLPDYRLNPSELSKNFFFLLADDQLITEEHKDSVSFLHQSVYELTNQKDLLTKCENIFTICNLIVNTLSIYESIFDLQFVCYIILKRIYFTFPQFRKQIEDILAMSLVNLSGFQGAFEKESTEECRLFITYLLNSEETDQDLKIKLNKRIESKGVKIEVKNEDDVKDVEYENLKLCDFNLRVGYPCSSEIDAGSEMSRYIEVYEPNSLVYVGFATHANDITLHLLKYVVADNEEENNTTVDTNTNLEDEEILTDKGHFQPILKLERIDSAITPVKIVMFVKEPGTYKLIWDNAFSWFTGKTLRYRLSVLRPLSQIDVERLVDFESIRSKLRTSISEPKTEVQLSPHHNKLLLVNFEGKNRSYKIDSIYNKASYIKTNSRYLIIPILLSNKRFRIMLTDDILEFSYDQEEHKDIQFNEFFEKMLTEYFSKVYIS
jgi:hypothetical protein